MIQPPPPEDSREKLVQDYEHIRHEYDELAAASETLIRQLLESSEIVPHHVAKRSKEPDSLSAKISLHPQYESLDDIPDLCGLRVILHFPSEVRTVTSVLAQEFDVIESEVHGAEVPELFEYASIHLICRINENRRTLREWSRFGDLHLEIQIRTVLQHAWAVISHGLGYKPNEQIPTDTLRILFRAAALLETADELFDTFKEGG